VARPPVLGLGGDADLMALRIGEHAERNPGYLLGRRHDRSAELLGLIERRGDIGDADEEEHLVSVGRVERRVPAHS
jgi:hypothetical protein